MNGPHPLPEPPRRALIEEKSSSSCAAKSVGQSLAKANLRATSGASVVAIMRDRELITNPEPQAILRANDLVGLVGNEEQLMAAQKVMARTGE